MPRVLPLQKDGDSFEDITWREARAPRCRSGGPLMILLHHPLSFINTTINKIVFVIFTIINNTIIVVIIILILEAPWLRAGQAGPCKRQVGAAADIRDWLIAGSLAVSHFVLVFVFVFVLQTQTQWQKPGEWLDQCRFGGSHTKTPTIWNGCCSVRAGGNLFTFVLFFICSILILLLHFLSVLFLYYYYIFLHFFYICSVRAGCNSWSPWWWWRRPWWWQGWYWG